jgi:cytidylate kinase
MPARVICLSHATAAGGEAVGRLVAERLGFRYVDEQIITRAGELAQVSPALVAATEKRQALLERLVDKLAAAQEMIGPVALGTLLPMGGALGVPANVKAGAPDDLRTLIRAAIHEVAAQGQAVIVAHAASMALGSAEGVLRVLITASTATRARRLVESEGKSQTEADALIAQFDRNRRDYFRRFYDIREEQPTHYDLVVNTDAVTPEEAAELVVFAARARA